MFWWKSFSMPESPITERTHGSVGSLVIKWNLGQSRNLIYWSWALANLHTGSQKASGESLEIHFAVYFFLLFFPLSDEESVILFVCPHTLGFNIHFHWHYMCGTGEHQLCSPICCRDRPKHLDPRNTKRKTTAGYEITVCVCLPAWRCGCVSVSFIHYIMSLDTFAGGILYSMLFTFHL